MAFSVKDWKDAPDATTPINATALEDMETRLSGYADTQDGINFALAAAAATLRSTIDAKGDILIGTANDTPDNFPAPANDNVLVADSGQTFGWKGDKVKAANVDSTLKSPAAGTEGLRTIGTGALEAAAGNHTHTEITDNRYDKDDGQAGVLAPMSLAAGAISNVAGVASRALFVRFVVSRSMTITKIAFVVGTAAGSNDNVDVGIYSGASSTLTRVVASGATAAKLNSTGVQEVTVTSTPLSPGVDYYAALAFSTFGGTAPSLAMKQFAVAGLPNIFGTGMGVVEACYKESTTLGSTVTSLTTSGANFPVMAVRES